MRKIRIALFTIFIVHIRYISHLSNDDYYCINHCTSFTLRHALVTHTFNVRARCVLCMAILTDWRGTYMKYSRIDIYQCLSRHENAWLAILLLVVL